MKSIDYINILQNQKNVGVQWVPVAGDLVNYHAIIGGDVSSMGHRVESVFPTASGHMVAFISGKRGHVAIEALSKASGQ
jgi:hypothetical protein